MAFKKGQSGNPGGMTPEQAEAKRVLAKWLGGPEMSKAFKDAYRNALDSGNATIIVDYANRLMGKVKEEVELSESEERPFKGAAIEKLLALADALKK